MDEAKCTLAAKRSAYGRYKVVPAMNRRTIEGGVEGAQGKDLPDRNPHPHGPLNRLLPSPWQSGQLTCLPEPSHARCNQDPGLTVQTATPIASSSTRPGFLLTHIPSGHKVLP